MGSRLYDRILSALLTDPPRAAGGPVGSDVVFEDQASETGGPIHANRSLGFGGQIGLREQAGLYRTIAISPLRSTANQFPDLFARSIAPWIDGNTMPFEWSQLGQGSYDAVIFHWPTEFFRPGSRRQTLAYLARAVRDKLFHGTSIYWVVHNLDPHEDGRRASALARSVFLRLLDGMIFLSEASRRKSHKLYPTSRRVPALVIPHGVYPNASVPPKPFVRPSSTCRLLFFGAIRRYKNPVALIRAVRAVNDADLSLSISGFLWDDDLAAEITAAAEGDRRIVVDIHQAPMAEAELEKVIDAHDAVVLPYRKVLNSGVALHALCRNKPVLAPNTGSLPELQSQVGADWVTLFDGQIAAPHIAQFVEHVRSIEGKQPDLSKHDWTRIGAETAAFLSATGRNRSWYRNRSRPQQKPLAKR